MSLVGFFKNFIYSKCVKPNQILNSEIFKKSLLIRSFSIRKFLLNEEAAVKEVGNTKIADASKDRSQVIPVETSIQYLKSSAYKTTYQNNPVWKQYKRNHKGQIAPRKTRKTCIRGNQISTGNPCPICRDEYLVLHPKNIDLLKQFISTYNGAVLSYQETGLCQRTHNQLLVAVKQAKDMGTISFDVPFRDYDYSEYIKN
uniref:Small ribosomal subunit protein mS40 n=1 Tax=Clastoptera arizonana TaxID=38151 RepID=A0A1B6CVR1_9HEMI